MKSRAVKPRASSKATASASPITSCMVVEVVGARPLGQASSARGKTSRWSASRARAPSGLAVTAISIRPKRREKVIISASSAVSPDHDRARMASPSCIMPISPWLASAGCTKNAGVPVEANVAASLRPIWPDLPMPVTTTRPFRLRIAEIAATKLRARPLDASAISASSAIMPDRSARNVLSAEASARLWSEVMMHISPC